MSIIPKQLIIRKKSRFTSAEYLLFVREYQCLVCSQPSECHHTVFKGSGGNHASDLLVVPLCRKHHAEVHALGSNDLFERKYTTHFETAIYRILKAFFRKHRLEWKEFASLESLEDYVSSNLTSDETRAAG